MQPVQRILSQSRDAHQSLKEAFAAPTRLPACHQPSKRHLKPFRQTRQVQYDQNRQGSDCCSAGHARDGQAVQGRLSSDAEAVFIGQMQKADEAEVYAQVRDAATHVVGEEPPQDVLKGHLLAATPGLLLVVLLSDDVPESLLQRPHIHLNRATAW